MREDEHGCLELSEKPRDCPDVQCPGFLDFHKTYRCTGRLFRAKILDAEVDSACCDRCFQFFSVKLIEPNGSGEPSISTP